MAASLIGMKLEPATWTNDTTPLTYRKRQQNAYAAIGKTLDYRIQIAAYQSDGVTVDTTVTSSATATVTVGGCTLGGTVTRTAVSGIWDFSDIYPATGTGSLAITFTSTGLTSFTTDTMTVVAPSYDDYALTSHGVHVELPRATVDPTLPTVFARTINVGATRSIVTGVSYKSIQAAIDYCITGSGGANDISGNTQIILDVETFSQAVILRTRAAGKGWIVISPATMPTTAGTRADLTVKALMPKLSVENAQGIIQCEAATHHIIIAGVNIEVPVPASGTATEIFAGIETGGFTPTSLTDLPHHIGIDRCLVHSTDITQTYLRRNISWQTGAGSYIVDSYIADAHNGQGSDTQAIGISSGIGPWLIRHNYLNAATEIVLAGGSDVPFYDCKARDVTFTGNHLYKPLSWTGDAAYLRKNVFELKTSERWLVEGNVMENSASGNQDGTGILITSQNQAAGNGSSSLHSISQNFQGNADITIRNNFCRTFVSWISATANNTPDTLTTRRISIHHNVAVNMNATVTLDTYGNGRSILIGDGIQDVVIEHNTIIAEAGRNTAACNIDAADTINNPRTYYQNNISTAEHNAFFGTGRGPGISTTSGSMTDDTLPNNVFITGPSNGTNYAAGAVHGVGLSDTGNYFPPQSYYPAALSDIGFVDLSITGSWQDADPDTVCAALALAGASAYKGVATNGIDPGADMTSVRSAIAGAWNGAALQTVTYLQMAQQPSTTALSNFIHGQQPVINLLNSASLLATGDTSTITASLITIKGTGTTIGTLAKTAVAGVVTFTDLGVTSTNGGVFKWRFTVGALTVDSNSFTVQPTKPPITPAIITCT